MILKLNSGILSAQSASMSMISLILPTSFPGGQYYYSHNAEGRGGRGADLERRCGLPSEFVA